MLRIVGLLFTLLLLALISLPVVTVLLAVEDDPLVAPAQELDYSDVERARALIAQNDPRRMAPGSTQTLNLSEEDINVMLRYGLSQLAGGSAAISVEPSALGARLAAHLPNNPLGSWLNINAGLSQQGERLALEYLEIGRLRIPGFIADGLLQLAGGRVQGDSLYRAVAESVRQIRLLPQRVAITYQWQPELVEQARARGSELLFSKADRERLLAYTAEISNVLDSGSGNSDSLGRLTTPLFTLARERSRGGDPAAENRALITALVVYVNGLSLASLIEVPDDTRYRPRRVKQTLQGRVDLAQHFTISAAMAVNVGSVLADAVGLSKEIDDTDGGSGFSFTDLAADRAGVRFAEALAGAEAGSSQALLAHGGGEDDYMPPVSGLPEFMGADRFAREYGSVGSPAYDKVVAEIERRIAGLNLHRR